jgi:hypothetical protein
MMDSPFHVVLPIYSVGVGVPDDPSEILTSMGKISEYKPNCRLTADGLSRMPAPTDVFVDLDQPLLGISTYSRMR